MAALTGNLASAFVNVTSTPKAGDEIRLIGWGQRTSDAIPHHVAFNDVADSQHVAGLHVQAAWQHQLADEGGLRLFGSYTLDHRSTDLVAPGVVVVERLRDGPVPTLLDPGIGNDRTWSLGGAPIPAWRTARPLGGASSVQSAFSGRVGERLNGVPARVWDFADPVQPSDWSERTFAAFIGDRVALSSRVMVNGGLRFESITGSAALSQRQRELAQSAAARRHPLADADFWELGAFGEYSRYGHRLPLSDLAYGDPTAPTAGIYRWNATGAAYRSRRDRSAGAARRSGHRRHPRFARSIRR